MGLRPTHRDENRFEPAVFMIELAWDGEDRRHSGLVEAVLCWPFDVDFLHGCARCTASRGGSGVGKGRSGIELR